MKKIVQIVIAGLLILVSPVLFGQQITFNEFTLSCSELTFQEIKEKYISLQELNSKIKNKLYERAPDYIYTDFVKEQKQWNTQRNLNVLEATKNQDKEEFCRIIFLEYLRIGTLLEDYNEYLYGLN